MTEWLPSVTWDVASFAEDDTAVQPAHKVHRTSTCATISFPSWCFRWIGISLQVSKTVAKKRASKARAIEELAEDVILFDTSIKGKYHQIKGQLAHQTEHLRPDAAQTGATVHADLDVKQLKRPQVPDKPKQQQGDTHREEERLNDPTRVSVKV